MVIFALGYQFCCEVVDGRPWLSELRHGWPWFRQLRIFWGYTKERVKKLKGKKQLGWGMDKPKKWMGG